MSSIIAYNLAQLKSFIIEPPTKAFSKQFCPRGRKFSSDRKQEDFNSRSIICGTELIITLIFTFNRPSVVY